MAKMISVIAILGHLPFPGEITPNSYHFVPLMYTLSLWRERRRNRRGKRVRRRKKMKIMERVSEEKRRRNIFAILVLLNNL